MPRPIDLNDPTATLLAVVRCLRQSGIDSAVYGGLALAAYGQPRETKDADVAVVGVGGAQGLEALERGGFEASLNFDRVRFGGNLVSRLALLGGAETTGLNVADLVEPRSIRYAALAVRRALAADLRGERVRILTPEDFVLFKVLSTRERDLEDAATVLTALGPRLDRALVEREAATLASEITDHDIRDRLERLLGMGS